MREIERRETSKYWVHLMLEDMHPFLAVHRKGVGTTHIDLVWSV